MATPNSDTAELAKAIDTLERLRSQALGKTRELQLVYRTYLQHESSRIAKKSGKEHPRVRQLNARLESSLGYINALEVEHEIARIKIPEVEQDSALIHGRVVDENLKGIAGVQVILVDGKDKAVDGTNAVTTGTSGYYAFVLNASTLAQITEKQKEGVFLAVSTVDGKTLYRESEPLIPAAGEQKTVRISIDRNQVFPLPKEFRTTQTRARTKPVTVEPMVRVPKKKARAKTRTKTAESAAGKSDEKPCDDSPIQTARYLGNTNTREFHDRHNIKKSCQIDEIKADHRVEFHSIKEAQKADYDFCAYCFGKEKSKR